MGNNAYISMRIKHIITEEYRDDLKVKPEAHFKFFVRNGTVQKVSCNDVYEYQGGDMVLGKTNCSRGMSKDDKKLFFRLIENALSKYKKIDYAYIYIDYKLGEREGLEHVRVSFEEEKHYRNAM